MGSNFFRIFIRLAIIFTITVFALQPYNWFCSITQKCNPVEFSALIPTREGTKPIEVFFEITNYRKNLILEPLQKSIVTVSGRKNIVSYRAKNLTNKPISFRTEFFVEPEELKNYIKTRNCLCFNEHKLKGGEEVELKMSFSLDEKAVNLLQKNQQTDIFSERKIENRSAILRYKVK